MSDLDKLMNKLNRDKVKDEVPTETPQEPSEDEFEDDLVDAEQNAPQEEKVEEVKPQEVKAPQEANAPQQDPNVDHEVALLQNDGVFRRELLFALKELVDVHKVNTQTLIDIKKKLYGEDDKKSE